MTWKKKSVRRKKKKSEEPIEKIMDGSLSSP